MNVLFKHFLTIIMAFILACYSIGVLVVSAAEDTSAPELISVEVQKSSINAGQEINVRVKVKESGTGLVKAMIQFNHSTTGDIMASTTQCWETPQYSSGQSYINYVFTVPTVTNTKDGDWFMAYLEFYDQKGNFSRYYGKPNNNQVYSEFIEPQQVLEGKTHVQVNGGSGDLQKPVIESIKIQNSTVEKSEKLKLEIEIRDVSALSYIQIDMSSKTDKYCYQQYEISSINGTCKYIFEIPINNARHTGEWEINEIYISDAVGNVAHYTNQINQDYFIDYYGENKDKFSLLKFTVIGNKGDETAPIVNGIKILNDREMVTKPGILQFELDITEDGSGVVCIDIEYERPNGEVPDVNSRAIYRICTKGYEDNQSITNANIMLDRPLKTGKYTLEVPVGSMKPNGDYEVHVRRMVDEAENEYVNYANQGLRAKFTLNDEFDYCFEMGITNGNLFKAVQDMQEGTVARILLSNKAADNILSKQIIKEIAGKNKTLVCYRDGYQWIFRGKDISGHQAKDLNLTTRIFTIEGKNLSSGQNAVGLSFENNGQLPGKVEFRFKSAFVKNYFGKEEVLRLYHVENTEGGYETDIDYVGSDYEHIPSEQANFKVVLDEKDAWCYVDLVHNSKYVVSDGKLTKLSQKQASKLQNSEATTSQNSEATTSQNSEEVSQNQPNQIITKPSFVVLFLVVLIVVLILTMCLCVFNPKARSFISSILKKLKRNK